MDELDGSRDLVPDRTNRTLDRIASMRYRVPIGGLEALLDPPGRECSGNRHCRLLLLFGNRGVRTGES